MNVREQNATDNPETAAKRIRDQAAGIVAPELPVTEQTARPKSADHQLPPQPAPATTLDAPCSQTAANDAEDITAGRVQAIKFAQKMCDNKHVDPKGLTP